MTITIKTTFTKKLTQLANLSTDDSKLNQLTADLSGTLTHISQLQNLDTKAVQPTYQVTGLENITRLDEVDEQRMFSQQAALANASATHDGYFVVPQLIDKE